MGVHDWSRRTLQKWRSLRCYDTMTIRVYYQRFIRHKTSLWWQWYEFFLITPVRENLSDSKLAVVRYGCFHDLYPISDKYLHTTSVTRHRHVKQLAFRFDRVWPYKAHPIGKLIYSYEEGRANCNNQCRQLCRRFDYIDIFEMLDNKLKMKLWRLFTKEP